MTVSATTNRVQYNGDGGTVTFPFTFGIFANTDLQVIKTSVAGVDTTLTLTTHYAVTITSPGDLPSAGSVVMVTAPATGEKLTILTNLPYTQNIDIVDGGSLPASSINEAHDRAVLLIQQLKELLGRSLTLSASSTSSGLTLPNPVALQFMRWNAAAAALENFDISSVGDLAVSDFAKTLLDDLDAAAARLTLGAMASNNFATAAEITTGTEAAKAVAPDQLKLAGIIPAAFATAAEELAGASLVKASSPGIAIPEHFSNLSFTATVAAKALTVSLKGADGNAPSATNKPKIKFRSATITDSKPVTREITGALTVTLSSGSTLGFTAAEVGRLYVWAIDNAGTVELALSRTADIFPECNLVTTTAEGGAGAADSASVMYSTSARTNVPCRCLGYIEITTGAVAGEWDNAPTKIQIMGPGIHRTGDMVQEVITTTTTSGSTASVIPWDNSKPQITDGGAFLTRTITPTNAVNKLIIDGFIPYVDASNAPTVCGMTLFKDAVVNALSTGANVVSSASIGGQIALRYEMIAGSTSTISFSTRVGPHAGTMYWLSSGAGNFFDGTLIAHLIVREVFA